MPKKTKLPKQALECARLLFRLIKRNNPNNTANRIHGLKWAQQIRRLHEIDKQPYFLIEAVIKWCQDDPFWKKNILSGEKLRKQWNNLTARMDIQKAKANELKREAEISEQKRIEKIKEEKSDLPKEALEFKERLKKTLKGRILPV